MLPVLRRGGGYAHGYPAGGAPFTWRPAVQTPVT